MFNGCEHPSRGNAHGVGAADLRAIGLGVPRAMGARARGHHLDRAPLLLQLRAGAVLRADGGPARNNAIDKLASRALWWFRWAAVATLLFGLLILSLQKFGNDGYAMFHGDYFKFSEGVAIATGILLGVTMFLNVWLRHLAQPEEGHRQRPQRPGRRRRGPGGGRRRPAGRPGLADEHDLLVPDAVLHDRRGPLLPAVLLDRLGPRHLLGDHPGHLGGARAERARGHRWARRRATSPTGSTRPTSARSRTGLVLVVVWYALWELIFTKI